jgi:hypothetical protein
VNTKHNVLDWFGPSHGVIDIRPVSIYYAIEIDSSIFFRDLSGVFPGFFLDPLILDVNLSYLFIVGEPTYRV